MNHNKESYCRILGRILCEKNIPLLHLLKTVTNKLKGHLFELITLCYIDGILWDEYPIELKHQRGLQKKDTGIDAVETETNTAIQCKYRNSGSIG